MKTQIELLIGKEWFKVAKVEHLTDRVLDALIDSYACVDAYRVRYEGKVIKFVAL